MPTTDRYTKVVLTLLAIGVWGLLLRPLVVEVPVWAQTGKPAKSPTKKYRVVTVDKKNTLGFDAPDASVEIQANAIHVALNFAAEKGYSIYAIIPIVAGTVSTTDDAVNGMTYTNVKGSTDTSYVIIVMK